jgi:secreted trypsin-like serine protease
MFAFLLLVSSLVPTPAAAVTYGDFVDSPQIQYPEVVPVWAGGSLCTGTLIEQQIVLTAAHCVYSNPGPIQVAVGRCHFISDSLSDHVNGHFCP